MDCCLASSLFVVDEAKLVLERTVKLSDVSDPTFYDAIFLPGGHGPVFDLAESTLLGDMLTKAAAAGKRTSKPEEHWDHFCIPAGIAQQILHCTPFTAGSVVSSLCTGCALITPLQ